MPQGRLASFPGMATAGQGIPSRKIAKAPFDGSDADADLIIESSDHVRFFVHGYILALAFSRV
jgi:hypothetical protein